MKVSVLVFPGSNCDHDVEHVCGSVLKQDVSMVWHKDHDLKNPDVVVVPGGFSYGDYLRTGALAKLSPIMEEVRKFAAKGGSVIGICNGFQILCEAQLLPGVLLQNSGMKFLSQFVGVRVERADTPFTKKYNVGDVIECPIAHGEGNYFADAETIKSIEGNGQVVFRYASREGIVNAGDSELNPNGSLNAIAGICNEKRNVVGMMPHPERASEDLVGYIGGETGRRLFESCFS